MSLGENSLVAAYQGKGQLKSRSSGTRVVTASVLSKKAVSAEKNRICRKKAISAKRLRCSEYFRSLNFTRNITPLLIQLLFLSQINTNPQKSKSEHYVCSFTSLAILQYNCRHMHISLLQDRQTSETTKIVLRFGYYCDLAVVKYAYD